MIHLFNHTRCPDRPIRDILVFAARAIGVKGNVCVKVIHFRRGRREAYASSVFPYRGFMRGARDRRGRNGQLLGDLPGYVVVSIRSRRKHSPRPEWLDICEQFAHCAMHEMAHIRQFRENRYFLLRQEEVRLSPGFRMPHDHRPCEVDAENQVSEAMRHMRKNLRMQDLVIALAIAIEEGT